MGHGDWIMATAEARRRQEGTYFGGAGSLCPDPRPCVIVDKHGRPTWDEVLDNNPRFAPRGTPISDAVQVLDSRPGNRPYIDYPHSTKDRWAWKDCPPERGEIYFSPSERIANLPSDLVIVEPNLKAKASPNKDWGVAKWNALAECFSVGWAQLGASPGRIMLRNSIWISTRSFRAALAYVAGARLYVGHEGALHHAAAALGIPAVVIFGGYVGPRQTGYEDHINLTSGSDPCGMRVPCDHCRAAMDAITVDAVAAAVQSALASPKIS